MYSSASLKKRKREGLLNGIAASIPVDQSRVFRRESVRVGRGHPEPNPGKGLCPLHSYSCVAIILTGPGLLGYGMGILIRGRVVLAAMLVECTSMSAYRLQDQNTGKSRLDCHSVNLPGWEHSPAL